jgi:DNA-binding response OmpR family regulator
MKTRILVAADDASLRAMLARELLKAGYAVELAENARHAREVLTRESVALAILAPHGMGTAGSELAREIKSKNSRLILVTETANDELPVESAPLVRPFKEQDLLARIQAELATPLKSAAAPEPASTSATETVRDQPQLLVFEGYTIDCGARTCTNARGQELALTRAEFSLLLALARQPGRVLSRDELSYVVAGRGAEPEDRSVDVLISRLRRKIEPDPKVPRIIVTMPGEGYRFSVKPEVVDTGTAMTGASLSARSAASLTSSIVEGAAGRHRGRRNMWIGATAAVLIAAMAAGWTAWHFRHAQQQMTKAPATPSSPSPTPQNPGAADEARHAMVYQRMVAAMHDDRFSWRTVERLAIDSGVGEAEAHEILAEHPNEVMLGESHDGKLLARLVDH